MRIGKSAIRAVIEFRRRKPVFKIADSWTRLGLAIMQYNEAKFDFIFEIFFCFLSMRDSKFLSLDQVAISSAQTMQQIGFKQYS